MSVITARFRSHLICSNDPYLPLSFRSSRSISDLSGPDNKDSIVIRTGSRIRDWSRPTIDLRSGGDIVSRSQSREAFFASPTTITRDCSLPLLYPWIMTERSRAFNFQVFLPSSSLSFSFSAVRAPRRRRDRAHAREDSLSLFRRAGASLRSNDSNIVALRFCAPRPDYSPLPPRKQRSRTNLS